MSVIGARRGSGVKVGAVAGAMFALMLVAPQTAAADNEVRFQEVPVNGWDTDGIVYAVRLVGDTVYIGGSFDNVVSPDGAITRERRNVAALDRITGEILPFRADTDGVVRGIDGTAGTVWIGGVFTEVGGVSRTRLAALNATTGAVLSGFDPAPNAVVWDVEYAGGTLYIGGEFNSVAGESHRKVAALDPTSGAPSADFQARGSGTVRALVMSTSNDVLYAAGSFTSIGGTSNDQLAGLDPVTGDVKGVDFTAAGATVLDVDVSADGTMVYGAVGGQQNRAQAWRTSDGAKSWNRTAMGDVQAVSFEDDRLYFGFHEGLGGDTNVKLLAADASSGVIDNSFRPDVNSFYGVWAIDATASGLIAGGEFTRVQGVQTRGVAIFPRDGIPDLLPPSQVGAIYATAGTSTSLELMWAPATDDVGISGYIVRRDGAIIAEAPGAAYLDTGLQPETAYSYTVEAIDTVGRSGGESPPSVLTTWARMVEPGSAWRYQDDGSAAAAWSTKTFDDSLWPSGDAQLGFGEGDEATTLATGEVTYYFRQSFFTPGRREVLSARLGLIRDDGAVVYVNGVEAYRSNMPSGPVGSETPASTTTGGSDESSWFEATIPAELFGPGINVVAVEVHQRNSGSSDVSFDFRLDAALSDEPFDQIPPKRPKGLVAKAKSPKRIRLDWQAAQDNEGIEQYLIFRDGIQVATTTELFYADKPLQPETEYTYKVFAQDTSLNIGPRSRIVRQTTLADVTPPSKPGQFVAVAISGNSITLEWNASFDKIGVDYYIVRRDGETMATTSDTQYVVDGLEPETDYRFIVRAVDGSGNKSKKARLNVSTTPLIFTFPIIEEGAMWRYLDDGSDQATAWQRRNFDDSSWSIGAAELGYGDGDEETVVAEGPGNDRHITTYFRQGFTIQSANAVPALALSLIRDDGAVVYINRTEVYRSNMPAGMIGYETRATAGVTGSDESDWIVVVLSGDALRDGSNTIAVEIHQSGPGSSDISFDLALLANP